MTLDLNDLEAAILAHLLKDHFVPTWPNKTGRDELDVLEATMFLRAKLCRAETVEDAVAQKQGREDHDNG